MRQDRAEKYIQIPLGVRDIQLSVEVYRMNTQYERDEKKSNWRDVPVNTHT